MRIVIDARLWGIKHTGPGRYTENLVSKLLACDDQNHYILLVRKEDYESISKSYPQAQVITVDAKHYSLKEQIILPLLYWRLKPDLLHVPHFNIPVLWPGKMVVTIHDLITHDFRGPEQTTLPTPVYWIKYFVHLVVIWIAAHRARAVVVPTNWVKEKVRTTFSLKEGNIFVTPEGVDEKFFDKSLTPDRKVLEKYKLVQPFLIYTGNAYSHKNLIRMIEAVKKTGINLVVVCARSVFRDRFEEKIEQAGAGGLVYLLGQVPDSDLRDLYRESQAFITTSLSEGFGLPGLEAMAAGTVVLSSNVACLPEVYKDNAIYFDPRNIDQIVQKINLVNGLAPQKRNQLIDKGIKHARTFSWKKTAQLTLSAYRYALSR
jgi:glycosyltransferase involved in cell wall biosynthesis